MIGESYMNLKFDVHLFQHTLKYNLVRTGYKKLISDFDTLDEIGGGARSGLDKYLRLPSIKSKNTKIEN